MKIAVTGSNGLIGRELVKRLRQKKFEVIECTRRNCDVRDKEKVKSALAKSDIVIHTAAVLEEDSPELFEVNVKGTENVLEACSEIGVQQFIFLSSVGVYGAAPGIKNENSPKNPVTGYEKSKAMAEEKVLGYQEVFPVTIFRPAIIVGRNKYWDGIIKLVKKNFPLIGNGKNHWQLVCQEDVIEAIVFAVNNEDCYGETFIIAEKNPMTLKELVEFIRKETGMKGKTRTIPYWIGMMLAHINNLIHVVPLLTPAYLERMGRDRIYSIKKIESTGFKVKDSAKDCLKKILNS